MKNNYKITLNKRRELELFEVMIICTNGFKPNPKEIKDILTEENLWDKSVELIKKISGGKIRVINSEENYFVNVDESRFNAFDKLATTQKKKELQIIIKKGQKVELKKENQTGKIIKNMSNFHITVQLEETGELLIVTKDDILKIVE